SGQARKGDELEGEAGPGRLGRPRFVGTRELLAGCLHAGGLDCECGWRQRLLSGREVLARDRPIVRQAPEDRPQPGDLGWFARARVESSKEVQELVATDPDTPVARGQVG